VKVIGFAIEAAGCPIAVGGAKTLLAAFERLIIDQGGAVRANADVVRILPARGRARAASSLRGATNNHGGQGRDLIDWARATYNGLLKDWPVPAPAEGSARP